MIIPDFRNFRTKPIYLIHSAKGSEWEDHKYVKKIDGIYYYPVGYEDGRTIDDLKGDKKSDDKSKETTKSKEDQINEVKKNFDQYLAKRGIDWRNLPKDEVDQMQRDIIKQLESGKETGTSEKSAAELAKDVMAGKFGEGEDRKKLLGDKYSEVQKIINGSTGSKKTSEATEESIKKVTKAAKNASKVHSGVNMDKVMSVYNKKKK